MTHQSLRDLSAFTATTMPTTKDSANDAIKTSSRPRLVKHQSFGDGVPAIARSNNNHPMGRGSRSDRRLTTRTGSERRLDMDRMASRRKLMTMRWEMCG